MMKDKKRKFHNVPQIKLRLYNKKRKLAAKKEKRERSSGGGHA